MGRKHETLGGVAGGVKGRTRYGAALQATPHWDQGEGLPCSPLARPALVRAPPGLRANLPYRAHHDRATKALQVRLLQGGIPPLERALAGLELVNLPEHHLAE